MIEGNDHDRCHLPTRDERGWDMVGLVRYLSRRALAGRLRDPGCRAESSRPSNRSEARAGSVPPPTTPIAA